MKKDYEIVEEDRGLTADQLSNKYEDQSDEWKYHPMFSHGEWVDEVFRHETRLGYWDWVAVQVEDWTE